MTAHRACSAVAGALVPCCTSLRLTWASFEHDGWRGGGQIDLRTWSCGVLGFHCTGSAFGAPFTSRTKAQEATPAQSWPCAVEWSLQSRPSHGEARVRLS